MISRNGKSNFLAAHYDWIALGVAAAVLAVAVVKAIGSFGTDPQAAASAAERRMATTGSSDKCGVEPVDLSGYEAVSQLLRKPPMLKSLPEKGENFLASELRVFCMACRSPRVAGTNACVVCGKVPESETKVEYDSDHDGMPNDWEERYGFNPKDASDATADADGDGFTNLEEFQAKTDPKDRSSHPDYLDSLKLVLPLDETVLPFTFVKVAQIPAGWRFFFRDPKKRNAYGKLGTEYSVLAGEQIGDTGWYAVSYSKKEEKRKIAGGNGAEKSVDVSTALVERKADKRRLSLTVGDTRHVAVDVQAKLVYERGETKTFTVVKGDKIDLNGEKYTVKDIKKTGKGASVSLEHAVSGKIKIVEPLEQ